MAEDKRFLLEPLCLRFGPVYSSFKPADHADFPQGGAFGNIGVALVHKTLQLDKKLCAYGGRIDSRASIYER